MAEGRGPGEGGVAGEVRAKIGMGISRRIYPSSSVLVLAQDANLKQIIDSNDLPVNHKGSSYMFVQAGNINVVNTAPDHKAGSVTHVKTDNLTIIQGTTASRDTGDKLTEQQHLDQVYISTAREKKVVGLLQDRKCIVITGDPGEGKTFLSKYLSQSYIKGGYTLLNIHSANRIQRIGNFDRCVVLIDDVFGSIYFDKDRTENWCRERENIEKYITDRKAVFIMTCRQTIYKEAECHIKRHKCQQVFKDFSLSAEKLSLEEKEILLRKHLRVNNITVLSDVQIQEIIQTRSVYGFPNICKMFSTVAALHHLRVSFFRSPKKFLMESLEEIDQNSEDHFNLLLLAALSNGEVPADLLECRNEVEWCDKIVDLQYNVKEHYKSFRCVEGTFIAAKNNSFVLVHDSIIECVLMTAFALYPAVMFKYCPPLFILKHICSMEANAGDDGEYIKINCTYYHKLASIFTRYASSVSKSYVYCNPSVMDPSFITRWEKYLGENEKECSEFFNFSIKDFNNRITNTLELIAIFAHSQFLKFVLRKKNGIAKIGEQEIRKLFLVACGRDHNEDAIKFILKHFAVDVTVADELRRNILHYACCGKAGNIIRFGLENKVRITQDVYGNTPLHYLFFKGNYRTILDKYREFLPLYKDIELFTVKPLIAVLAKQYSKNSADATVQLKPVISTGESYVTSPKKLRVSTLGEILILISNNNDEVVLHCACDMGDIEATRYILLSGEDVNIRDCYRYTPLYHAVRKGHTEIVSMLIEAGADVKAKCDDGSTPLHMAAHNGYQDLANMLIKAGADVRARCDDGSMPLHKAAHNGHVEIVSMLIRARADIGARCGNGSTPLHMAAHRGHKDIVSMLLTAGADVNSSLIEGSTVLFMAAYKGRTDIVRMLLDAGADVRASRSDGSTPIYEAARNCYTDIFSMLLAAGADVSKSLSDGYTVLHEAVWLGHTHIVSKLLEAGAAVNASCNDGCMPLHLAVRNDYADIVNMLLKAGADVQASLVHGSTALLDAARLGHANIVTNLLAAGADIKARRDDHCTALLLAASEGHTDIVSMLLVAGADVETSCNDGCTALYIAASEGHKDVVRMLLAAGADVETSCNDGCTALYIAASEGHKDVVSMLLAAGADVETSCNDGCTALYIAASEGHKDVVSMLLAAGADVETSCNDGCTALYIAASEGHKDVVSMLLAAGADVETSCNDGYTALYIAASEGHKDVVSMLLAAGADVETSCNDGYTALYIAAAEGHKDVVSMLLAAGADVETSCNDGCTALYIAASEGHKDVVRMLLAAGADVRVSRYDGCTALHRAVFKGHKDIVRMLLAAGADVRASRYDGCTALHKAVFKGHKDIVRMLLAAGADVNASFDYVYTTLDLAEYKGYVGILGMLHNAGADDM